MIDFIAAGFELTGAYSLGNRKRWGFLLNAAGDILWAYIGIITKLYGLVSIAGLAFVFNIRNFLKWRRET